MRTFIRQSLLACILLFGTAGMLQSQNHPSMKKTENPPRISAFPTGEKNLPQFSQYFIGQSYLAPLATEKALNCPIYNVTFEPGCRNNWHSHTGGQILIAVGGKGYYQEKGKEARLLRPGDVVEIAPDVVHWHGAAPDSWFSHLAVECNPQTNRNSWFEAVDDKQYAEATGQSQRLTPEAANAYQQWFPTDPSTLVQTDPELAEVFGNFAFGDTQRYGNLSLRTRILVTMAAAVAQGARGEYRRMLQAGYSNGLTPIELKEVLYHAVPYIGMSKTRDFIDIANQFLNEQGVALPQESQSVTDRQTRMEKGLALQKSIFGNNIDKMYETSPANQLHIQEFLSANCFGDYQTRPVFDTRTRELLTFALLISLGGCEPQVKGHIQGNVNVGNGKDILLATVTQLLPYIGYPRTLNAIACLNEVIPEQP